MKTTMRLRAQMRPSEKIIGRKKIRFHLDDLVYFRRDDLNGTITFSWFCMMLEPFARLHLAGAVGCGRVGLHYDSKEECEEDALNHLVNDHRAVGGERRRK